MPKKVADAMNEKPKYIIIEGHRYAVRREGGVAYVVVRGVKYALEEAPKGVCIYDSLPCEYPDGFYCRGCSRIRKKARVKRVRK